MKQLPTKTVDGKLHYGLTHFKDLALLPDEMLEQAIHQITPLILQIKLFLVAADHTEGSSAQHIFDLLEDIIWFCPNQDGEDATTELRDIDGQTVFGLKLTKAIEGTES